MKPYKEKTSEELPKTSRRLAEVKNVPIIYNNVITESGLRKLIFHEYENDFHACVKRCGRKVLIDLDAFETWLDKPKNHKPFNTIQAPKWKKAS